MLALGLLFGSLLFPIPITPVTENHAGKQEEEKLKCPNILPVDQTIDSDCHCQNKQECGKAKIPEIIPGFFKRGFHTKCSYSNQICGNCVVLDYKKIGSNRKILAKYRNPHGNMTTACGLLRIEIARIAQNILLSGPLYSSIGIRGNFSLSLNLMLPDMTSKLKFLISA